jgi:hypothetical protein
LIPNQSCISRSCQFKAGKSADSDRKWGSSAAARVEKDQELRVTGKLHHAMDRKRMLNRSPVFREDSYYTSGMIVPQQ